MTHNALPRAMWKVFRSDRGAHVLAVEGSRVFDVDSQIGDLLMGGDAAITSELADTMTKLPCVPLAVPAPLPPQSISLNVSATCNLSCSYCYAGRGGFAGAQVGTMSWPVARAAVDALLAGCSREAPATVGFIGGEPFVARGLIHQVVNYSANRARSLGQDIRFSVTTNGELLREEDLALMRSNPFSVTISVDGGPELHERQRPGAKFDRLAKLVKQLIAERGLASVSARATVTRQDMHLITRFDTIASLGFADIGFSPVRIGPADQSLSDGDWERYLVAMTTLARRELARIQSSQHSAFSNLLVALSQIHRGACSPYPCGAGGGYFSVAVDGRWYACHRTIGDEQFEMGDSNGLDTVRRATFLAERHVDAQTDCRTCWARYLCSGACHQEAATRGAAACNFIRSWLEFCLGAYAELSPAARRVLFKGE